MARATLAVSSCIPVCSAEGSARLMREIEERFPQAGRYELFTGHLSEGNLGLYRRLGYEVIREEDVSPRLRLVYLEKSRVPGEAFRNL